MFPRGPLPVPLPAVLLALLLAVAPGTRAQDAAQDRDGPPEADTGRTEKAAVRAKKHMIVSAHPLASQAGLAVLREGGNALDAAIAAAFVLALVEPQSAGVGGGGFLLHYDAGRRRMASWDGREIAPLAAEPGRFIGADGRPMRFRDAIGSGRSVGVPGLVAMLEMAHSSHGRLRWERLLAPAIALARDGFPVSRRLAALVAVDPLLRESPTARPYFFRADGSPLRAGDTLRNPAFSDMLARIARDGSGALHYGEVARDIVAAVNAAGGDMRMEDMARYFVKPRAPLCAGYRGNQVCGMGPPSSGAVAVGMILGLLERATLTPPMSALAPLSAEAVHRYSEAARLAYADRDHYIADPEFSPAPVRGLLSEDYLAARAGLIGPGNSMKRAQPGEPAMGEKSSRGADATESLAATTHLSVVDGEGNAVALTASIESAFGSRIMVRGFLLNNQLTDFSWIATEDGKPVANRVQGWKRPRSSMAPTMVFDADRRLAHILGSPGGNQIINYVARSVVALVDWKLDMQQAVSLPHYGSRNRATELERAPELEALAPQLRQRGHDIRIGAHTSGLHGISVLPDGLLGGADPRREGVALGD